MFEPTDDLVMRLTVAEWNQIMGMLGEQKYSLVVSLIQKINGQAATQHDEKAAVSLHPRPTAVSSSRE